MNFYSTLAFSFLCIISYNRNGLPSNYAIAESKLESTSNPDLALINSTQLLLEYMLEIYKIPYFETSEQILTFYGVKIIIQKKCGKPPPFRHRAAAPPLICGEQKRAVYQQMPFSCLGALAFWGCIPCYRVRNFRFVFGSISYCFGVVGPWLYKSLTKDESSPYVFHQLLMTFGVSVKMIALPFHFFHLCRFSEDTNCPKIYYFLFCPLTDLEHLQEMP